MDGADSSVRADDGGARKSRGAGAIADGILDGSGPRPLKAYVEDLRAEATTTATQAARVVEEVVERAPALGAPFIPRLIAMLGSDNARVVQACAASLPRIAAVAPAKVAKRMPLLRECFDTGDEAVRDGVLRTFVALCAASVAYQKRLIDLFERALREAEPPTLASWTPTLLPTLKGEPYAQAREAVEQRLGGLPAREGQEIAAYLGLKWRASPA